MNSFYKDTIKLLVILSTSLLISSCSNNISPDEITSSSSAEVNSSSTNLNTSSSSLSSSSTDLNTSSSSLSSSSTNLNTSSSSLSSSSTDLNTSSSSLSSSSTDLNTSSSSLSSSSTDLNTSSSSLIPLPSSSSSAEPIIISNCTDSEGLPKCVSDMSAAGGGTIILAAQTYTLTEKLFMKDNVNIVGQGSSTIIKWDETIEDTVDQPMFWASSVNNIALKDLTFECHIDQDPESKDLRKDHIAIYFYGGGDPSVDEATNINNILLERIEAYNCSHGIHIKGATDVTAIDLNLHNNGNTEVDLFHNIYWRRVANLVVKQTTATSGGFYDSPRGHGIRGSHLKNVYFENLGVHNNADHGIHFDNVEDVRFNNLDVSDNCANPSGSCNEIKCYIPEEGNLCDIEYDAAKED